MDTQRRRSALRKTKCSKDEDAAVSTPRINRRISFSGRNLVREFRREEEPKAWENSYEISDNLLDEAASKIYLVDKQNVPVPLEMIQSIDIPHQKDLTCDENMPSGLQSNPRNVTNSTYQNDVLHLENSFDITLFEKEKQYSKQRYINIIDAAQKTMEDVNSFSLDEGEAQSLALPNHARLCEKTADFMQDLRSKSLEKLSPKDISVAEAESEHDNKSKRCMQKREFGQETNIWDSCKAATFVNILPSKSSPDIIINDTSVANCTVITDCTIDITINSEPNNSNEVEKNLDVKSLMNISGEDMILEISPDDKSDIKSHERPKTNFNHTNDCFTNSLNDNCIRSSKYWKENSKNSSVELNFTKDPVNVVCCTQPSKLLVRKISTPIAESLTTKNRKRKSNVVENLSMSSLNEPINEQSLEKSISFSSSNIGKLSLSPDSFSELLPTEFIKYNFKQLNDEIELGKILQFPKTPTTEQNLKEKNILSKKMTPIERRTLYFEGEVQQSLNISCGTGVRLLHSKADDSVVGGACFLYSAELGDDTMLRNCTKINLTQADNMDITAETFLNELKKKNNSTNCSLQPVINDTHPTMNMVSQGLHDKENTPEDHSVNINTKHKRRPSVHIHKDILFSPYKINKFSSDLDCSNIQYDMNMEEKSLLQSNKMEWVDNSKKLQRETTTLSGSTSNILVPDVDLEISCKLVPQKRSTFYDNNDMVLDENRSPMKLLSSNYADVSYIETTRPNIDLNTDIDRNIKLPWPRKTIYFENESIRNDSFLMFDDKTPKIDQSLILTLNESKKTVVNNENVININEFTFHKDNYDSTYKLGESDQCITRNSSDICQQSHHHLREAGSLPYEKDVTEPVQNSIETGAAKKIYDFKSLNENLLKSTKVESFGNNLSPISGSCIREKNDCIAELTPSIENPKQRTVSLFNKIKNYQEEFVSNFDMESFSSENVCKRLYDNFTPHEYKKNGAQLDLTTRQSLNEFLAYEQRSDSRIKRLSENLSQVSSEPKNKHTLVTSALEFDTSSDFGFENKSLSNDDKKLSSEKPEFFNFTTNNEIKVVEASKSSYIPEEGDNMESIQEKQDRLNLNTNHERNGTESSKSIYMLEDGENMESVQDIRKGRTLPEKENLFAYTEQLTNARSNFEKSMFEDNPITISDVSVYFINQRKNKVENYGEANIPLVESTSESFHRRYINLTCDSPLDNIDKTSISLVKSLSDEDENEGKLHSAENDDAADCNKNGSKVKEGESTSITNAMLNVSTQPTCKRFQSTVIYETASSSAESFTFPALPPVPDLDITRLKRMRARPHISHLQEFWCRSSISRAINPMSIISQEENLRPGLTINNDCRDCDNMAQKHQSFESGVNETIPITSFKESSISNLYDTLRYSNWILDFQLQYYGTLILVHRKLLTFCLAIFYEYVAETGSIIQIRSIKCETNLVSHRKIWEPIAHVLDFQLKLNFPINLFTLCENSTQNESLRMLQKMDQICLETVLIGRQLQRVVFNHGASFLRDDNRTFVRKIIRQLVSTPGESTHIKKVEFRIELLNIKNVCYKDITMPPLYNFCEDLHTLPIGLEFLKEFLNDPTRYLKYIENSPYEKQKAKFQTEIIDVNYI